MRHVQILCRCAVVASLVAGLTALAAAPAVAAGNTAPAAPTSLTVDGRTAPLGIGAAGLSFGWIVNDTDRGEVQTAYQVLVGTDPSDVAKGYGATWDSGKVSSDESVAVSYIGPALASAKRYYWTARTWDKDGAAGVYAPAQFFETGLLSPADWTATWIQGANGNLYRKQFDLTKPIASARLYATAQGMYRARINGADVPDNLLDPMWTTWDKRVLVRTYDVTTMLVNGTNAIGMTLASGHYGTEPYKVAAPRALAQLVVTYADGSGTVTIGTDTSWRSHSGPLTYISIGAGETYAQAQEQPGWDRAGFNDASWATVTAPTDTITASLEPTVAPPSRVVGTLRAQSITPVPGKTAWVLDFGQNVTGWGRLTTTTRVGQTLRVTYGERLDPSTGEVVTRSPQSDNFSFSRAEAFTYTAQFDTKGFRYAEIVGNLTSAPTTDTVVAEIVNDDVGSTGRFDSSDAMFTAIDAAQRRTRLNTLHSVPEDNPNRERRGWGADATVTSDAALYDFPGMAALYEKFLGDIRTGQGVDGAVRDVNPFTDTGGFSNDAAWASVLPMIAWRTYQYAGDRRIVSDNYAAIKAWVDFIQRNLSQRGLVETTSTNSSAQISRWGDWFSAQTLAPPPLLYSSLFVEDVRAASSMATLLGNTADAQAFTTAADSLAGAVRAAYLNPTTHTFSSDQVGNSAALNAGIVPSQYVDTVVAAIVNSGSAQNGHLAGGVLGVQQVVRALSEHGRSDLVAAYLDKTDKPSFGFMLANGPGTIWEDWDGTSTANSLDQPAFGGAPGEWFYRYVAGIQPQAGAGQGGYHDVVLAPQIEGTGSTAAATVQTVRGPLSSAWSRSGNNLTYSVTVPVNSHATVAIPRPGGEQVAIREGGALIYESGVHNAPQPGLVYLSTDPRAVQYAVGSGTYVFTVGPATTDLALGRPVTVRSSTPYATWAPAALTDAIATSTPTLGGYHSTDRNSDPLQQEWAVIDLGSSQSIGAVTLYPANGGFGFPVRFAIQVSDSPSFGTVTTFADRSAADYPNPGATPQRFTGTASGRYVRILVSKLARLYGTTYSVALAEMSVSAATG
ncbi:MAG: alpha-L-rhamnosidase [Pseudonocardiales bacterium]|nr:alpha-L-rhamnosidase [Pseudonocardiales bacterium]